MDINGQNEFTAKVTWLTTEHCSERVLLLRGVYCTDFDEVCHCGHADGLRQRGEELLVAQEQRDRARREEGFGSVDWTTRDDLLSLSGQFKKIQL